MTGSGSLRLGAMTCGLVDVEPVGLITCATTGLTGAAGFGVGTKDWTLVLDVALLGLWVVVDTCMGYKKEDIASLVDEGLGGVMVFGKTVLDRGGGDKGVVLFTEFGMAV
ncbi:uncharacterized protein MELLADRAFT_110555 [Melampsora larici-populina 98AG31]|uniref:Uncharacterized protein n=1 Tax=Melampsora larici-populina (strain 98AG31 / pathotype 3-4-7) TaxID=747676 RepID=F4S072_MELLP|nr:uncharacterized protein MELLADRAFT_110555 [Melampsora larici-populina 98AG31]EGG01911.1 hypothetical protein MELLADRAFT_110555 [Melampsora larici-populina 98AG31]